MATGTHRGTFDSLGLFVASVFLVACTTKELPGPFVTGSGPLEQTLATPLASPLIDVRVVCGAAGDGITDDAPAIQKCLNKYPNAHFVFPKTQDPNAADGGVNTADYLLTNSDPLISSQSAILVLMGADVWLEGTGGGVGNGTVLRFSGSTSKPAIGIYNKFAVDGGGFAGAAGAKISNLNLLGPTNSNIGCVLGTNTGGDGIYVSAHKVVLSSLFINNFDGHGVQLNATGIDQNANSFLIEEVDSACNGGDGFHTEGTNTSAGVFLKDTASGNRGWGFSDSSAYGNSYVEPETDSNIGGSFNMATTVGTGGSVLIKPYAEANQERAILNSRTMVIGGILSRGYDKRNRPGILDNDFVANKLGYREYASDTADGGASPTEVYFGTYGVLPDAGPPSFGGVFYALNAASSSSGNIEFRQVLDAPNGYANAAGAVPGWWGFRTGDNKDHVSMVNYPLLMSDGLARNEALDAGVGSLGFGWTWFPNGFLIGNNGAASTRRKISIWGSVSNTPYNNLDPDAPGDIIFSLAPDSTNKFLGWIAMDWTKTGWRAFGAPGDSDTNPHSERATFATFLPGSLDTPWDGSSWTPDKAITVTRMEVRLKSTGGCTVYPTFRIGDGTTSVTVVANSGAYFDTGAISTNFAAGVTLLTGIMSTSPAPSCATPPKDANVVVQYRLQ